jgi:hypothetical protein
MNLLSGLNGSSPKSEALLQILEARSKRKTIVFTTAIATALDLAHRLAWEEVAVVGAGASWIASGRIPVDEALALFAPAARGIQEPHRSLRVSTLIATDLASEGLDLQDADAVVHYDLAWTPLKLDQRVGRIARLGSMFRTSDVFWFAPPDVLEQRLRLEARIATKFNDQIGMHVAATSRVGRGRIVNEALNRRERLGQHGLTEERCVPRFAVVRGPLSAAVAVSWTSGRSRLPELITLHGDPPHELTDFADIDEVLTRLLAAPSSRSTPPPALVDRLLNALRERLAFADRADASQSARRHTRRLLSWAHKAGKSRERRLLATLDPVLDRLRLGLNIGGERSLSRILAEKPSPAELSRWLEEQPSPRSGRPAFEVVGALFGDGSEQLASGYSASSRTTASSS